eukprot:TRINITY_DN13673_c0_g3_i1.p1 TRINITY_DN13673_c0_g3~~TRINITY_DN13673_c0_g3_i1.p1  ORF type:complete len:486 (-),score=74.97 TRINITY_DN13673_c0_g3_i1:1066-2523(-)
MDDSTCNSLQMPDEIDLDEIFGSFDQSSLPPQPSTLQQPQGVGFEGNPLGIAPNVEAIMPPSTALKSPPKPQLNLNINVNANQEQFMSIAGVPYLGAMVRPEIMPANPLMVDNFMQGNSNSTDDLFGSGDEMDILSQGPNTGQNRRSKKNRTPQQQKQNKLAQQRYRERKKQKYGNMEKAVASLTEKAQQLEQAEQKNSQLQGQNEFLSGQVSELQYEVSRLRAQIAQQQQFGGQKLNIQQQVDGNNSQQQVQNSFSELKEIMQKYDLDTKNENNLYRMNCQESRRFGKLVSSCILASVNGQSALQQNNDVNKRDYVNLVKQAIQQINVTTKQADQIISYRNSFLSKFNQFQDKREKLNLKVMSFLVQQSHELCEVKTPNINSSKEQKFDGLQSNMQRDVQLQVTLEQLQMVMLETKRCYDEFVGHVLKEVLGIVQRAVLVTSVYPCTFDMLIIANVIQQERNLLKSQSTSNSSSSGIYVEVITV